MLLHGGRIGLDRSASIDVERARQVNEQLLELILSGRSYAHVLAPASGNTVELSLVEALLLQGQRLQLSTNELEQHLLKGLTALGRSINGEPAALLAAFGERQPHLEALGILP